jgi:sirohydrochlorin ferrochelatase
MSRVALQLIAHGSRRAEANADLEFVATQMRDRGRYPIVQVSYLELAEPSIEAGGALCVQQGATQVILLPYFLSAGVHFQDDLRAARDALNTQFPAVQFVLAEPLGRHPLLLDVIEDRAREALPVAREITLEEWIASTQSCCGVEPGERS